MKHHPSRMTPDTSYCDIKIKFLHLFIWIFLTIAFTTQSVLGQSESNGLTVSSHDITVLVNSTATFDVLLTEPLNFDVYVKLEKQHDNLINLKPKNFSFEAKKANKQIVTVVGLLPGHVEVTATSIPDESWLISNLFVRVTVANSEAIIYVSLVFGWVYFVAWSISFYPQIIINFRRKSVVGLNFDFVILNIVGFTMYSLFNCGLYWIPSLQAEYSNRYPRSVNPVMLNDVVFSLHAMFATILTIIQCFAYERADQKISKVACGILSGFGLFILISTILAAVDVIHWLDLLYFCSYVKLTITVIKYVPQARMNYLRKSTVGWSIENIILDFTGGTLSMLQMILNAYNYDDWVSIFGDPTKFGLGLFSVLFDIVFMLQHYVFYSLNCEVQQEKRCPKCMHPIKSSICCSTTSFGILADPFNANNLLRVANQNYCPIPGDVIEEPTDDTQSNRNDSEGQISITI